MESGLAIQRLNSQRLGFQPLQDPVEVVRHMCALQAQDFEMAKWAIGVRMVNPDIERINKALDSGMILRTHIFRPTWHFIPGEDLKWMMAFSGPYIKKLNASQEKKLGLDPSLFGKTRKIIEKAFIEKPFLTKDEIVLALKANKINTAGEKPQHILYDAECCSLICSGPQAGHRVTYALVENRLRTYTNKTGEEALTELTKRYFQSHGPATARDLANWMSLPVAKVKEGIGSLGSLLQTRLISGQLHYFIPSAPAPRPGKDSFFILPAYDEYLIGYSDRSFALEEEFRLSTMTTNGILYPTLVYQGNVKGKWSRKKTNTGYSLEFNWFTPPSPSLLSKVQQSVKAFAKFTGKEIAVTGIHPGKK